MSNSRAVSSLYSSDQNHTSAQHQSSDKQPSSAASKDDFEVDTKINRFASINYAGSSTPLQRIQNIDNDPEVRLVSGLLIEAIQMGASDLHFEPYEDIYRIRFRIDGVMRLIKELSVDMVSKVSSRLKIMGQMDISERRLPQDGRISITLDPHAPDTHVLDPHKTVDFRVNSLPTMFGEKIVLRVIDSVASLVSIDNLGLEPDQKVLFLEAIDQPQGVILITGPTGSGKTVSLYTGLNLLNKVESNLCSVEDPVEFSLTGINQVNVNHKVGLTFASALKSFLRQDPDVVMVGEIRDFETADTVIKAAQTGHLVLSTLHTNSAPETLTRLNHMGVPYFNIATAINLVISQRLARRLCERCKTPTSATVASLIEMGFPPSNLHKKRDNIYDSVGCEHCHQGYKGRIGIFEVIKIDDDMTHIILQAGNAVAIKEAAEKQGFYDLRDAAILKVLAGKISIQEMNRITIA